jgi:hypothetical protein
VLINRARNPSIFRRRFPIRLWNPSQHLLRQNPPPRSQFGSRRGCRRTGTARVACSSGPVLPLPTIRMTSGASATNSAAYLRMRSGSPAAQRSSMRIEPSAELRIPNAAAQTRMVSVAKSQLDRRKSTRLFKGIICDDISEFESHMPSHGVGSLGRVYPVHGLCEQRR